jgi:hypothetical protein
MRSLFFVLSAAALIAGPALAAPAACPSGLHPATTAELDFRQDSTDTVSDADWAEFLHDEVTPRFSGGLPVSDVYGQDQGPSGPFIRLPSQTLVLVLAGTADERANLRYIQDAYELRFHQRPVLLVEPKACVSF